MAILRLGVDAVHIRRGVDGLGISQALGQLSAPRRKLMPSCSILVSMKLVVPLTMPADLADDVGRQALVHAA